MSKMQVGNKQYSRVCKHCCHDKKGVCKEISKEVKIKKYRCPNCGEVDRIEILEGNTYTWKNKNSGYVRVFGGQRSLIIKCSKCDAIIV